MIQIATEVILIVEVKSISKDITNLVIKRKDNNELETVCNKEVKIKPFSIMEYIINILINEVALGKTDKHIYMVQSNSLLTKNGTYSNKTIKFFIRNQKRNNDKFFIVSNNPVSLITGTYIGMIPKIKRRLNNGK